MPEQWFDAWVGHHSTVFGMDREQDLATFLSWRELFVAAGYTAAELTEATDWVAVNVPLKYRSEHLAALQERIRTRRAEALAKDRRAEISWPDCHLCGGCAFVSVPVLSQVADGRWHGYATCAVFCACPRGQRERERFEGRCQGKRKIPLALAEYEPRNPAWREQLDARKAFEGARLRAENSSRYADKRLGPILKRIMDKVKDRAKG